MNILGTFLATLTSRLDSSCTSHPDLHMELSLDISYWKKTFWKVVNSPCLDVFKLKPYTFWEDKLN